MYVLTGQCQQTAGMGLNSWRWRDYSKWSDENGN